MTVDELIASTPDLQQEAKRHPIATRLLAAIALDTDRTMDAAPTAAIYCQLGLQVGLYERASAGILLAALQDLYADGAGKPITEVVALDQSEAAALVARVLPSNVTAPPPTDVGACRSCGAAIYWIVTPKGKRAPMNLDPCTDLPLDPPVNHFVTCPDSKGWKKGR